MKKELFKAINKEDLIAVSSIVSFSFLTILIVYTVFNLTNFVTDIRIVLASLFIVNTLFFICILSIYKNIGCRKYIQKVKQNKFFFMLSSLRVILFSFALSAFYYYITQYNYLYGLLSNYIDTQFIDYIIFAIFITLITIYAVFELTTYYKNYNDYRSPNF